MKELFSKDSPGKGRPPLSDEVIDVLADLQTKNHASANEVGAMLMRCGVLVVEIRALATRDTLEAECSSIDCDQMSWWRF